ncbi:hypothetical protein NHQ30_003469 [Ciborinia camelliae]|nr:hypothetical protein NHQ30_003469 [Ciborinia camelliae]
MADAKEGINTEFLEAKEIFTRKEEGKNDTYPGAYQCTWRPRTEDGGFDFFLGHAFGGPKGPPEWKELVRRTRCDLLMGFLKDENWGWDNSPDIINRRKTQPNNAGTNFGNCGETYPFLALMTDRPETSFGYAMARMYWKPNTPKTYNPATAKKNYLAPCVNCIELLRILGGNADNFKIDIGWDDGVLPV